MEKGYYKPTLGEFVPGFKFEYWEPVDQEWVEETITESTDMQEIEDMLKPGSYRPIRVISVSEQENEMQRMLNDSKKENFSKFKKLVTTLLITGKCK